MNKPITLAIKEVKAKMIGAINESGLSPIILDLVLQGIYSEVHTLAEKQTIEEERLYIEAIKDNDIDNGKIEIGDINESE